MTEPLERLAAALAGLDRGSASPDQVIGELTPAELHRLTSPQADATGHTGLPGEILSSGIGAGRLAAGHPAAGGASSAGARRVVLCDQLSNDLLAAGHDLAAALTTAEDPSSHAVIVARSLGLPVLQLSAAAAAELRRSCRDGIVTVDAVSGLAFPARLPLTGTAWPAEVHRLVELAASRGRISVYANADQPAEVARALRAHCRGFEPRLEHMLVSRDGLAALRGALFAETDERASRLGRLREVIRESVAQAYQAAGGQPVYIRLLDPPIHEFIPSAGEMPGLAAQLGITHDELAARCARAREVNPMLGLRGARLLLMDRELCGIQLEAIRDAAAQADATAYLTLPMITAAREVADLREMIREAFGSRPRTPLRVGVMAETPRAALLASELAPLVDHVSFGTNDLTAHVFGISRGDAYQRYLQSYLDRGIFEADPFAAIDRAVAELITTCISRSRAISPDITFTICGEQASHQTAIELAGRAGVNALAVPIALIPSVTLAVAQQAARAPGYSCVAAAPRGRDGRAAESRFSDEAQVTRNSP